VVYVIKHSGHRTFAQATVLPQGDA
jgi:hypothetical protein